MALYYLDTSALVKLYVREPGSDLLIRLADRTNRHRFAVLALARAELHAALRRRQRDGDLDAVLAEDLLNRFNQHLESRFERQLVSDSLIDLAANLVDRHPLRAYDAVQLAGCLMLRANSANYEPNFVCSDRKLLQAAKLEGVACLDPTD